MVKLCKEELEYLLSSISLSEVSRNQLKSALKNCTGISDDLADDLREKCGERLSAVGFDSKHEPTKEGRLLESLIDKLYVD